MDASNARKAIEEAGKRLGDALTKRDAKVAAACYTEDARLLPPDGQIVSGRAAIEQFWGKAMAKLGVKSIVLKTDEVLSGGDVASEIGHAALKLESGGSASIKYIVVWKRSGDGQWRLHRDIWNATP